MARSYAARSDEFAVLADQWPHINRVLMTIWRTTVRSDDFTVLLVVGLGHIEGALCATRDAGSAKQRGKSKSNRPKWRPVGPRA